MAKRISKDMKQILDKIPNDKKSIAKDVIDELIFMKKTLQNLKDTIKSYEEDGQKYLKIKIKEIDEKNNELYETFYNQHYFLIFQYYNNMLLKYIRNLNIAKI